MPEGQVVSQATLIRLKVIRCFEGRGSLFGRRSDCPICDSSLIADPGEGWRLTRGASPSDWFMPHCRNTHQDYLAWKGSKNRLSRILGFATVITTVWILFAALLILGLHPTFGRNTGEGIFLLPIVFSFFLPSELISRWGIGKFRREWRERGGLPAPSIG